MKKLTLILTLFLCLICTSCTESMWTGKDTYVVTQIETATDQDYVELGKYKVTAQCQGTPPRFIIFNTDSIYNPGDTLYIKK